MSNYLLTDVSRWYKATAVLFCFICFSLFCILMLFYLCNWESLVSVMWGCVEQQPGIYSRQKCVSAPFFLDTTGRDEHYLSSAELSLKRLLAVCRFFFFFFCQLQRHFHVCGEWQDLVTYTNETTHFFFFQRCLKCLNFIILFVRTSIFCYLCSIVDTHSTLQEETGHQIQYICFLSDSISEGIIP